MEPLTVTDLVDIITDRFPVIDVSIVNKMVGFVQSLEDAVMTRRSFGQSGSPWEFNLRDVFRWSELMIVENRTDLNGATEYADALFVERFRSEDDRAHVRKLFEKYFGRQIPLALPRFQILGTEVCVGHVALKRNLCHHSNRLLRKKSNFGSDSAVIRRLRRPMETVARCINMNWPCLIVGSTSSGKTSLLKTLSSACNIHLEEIALTPSTDVSELLGCFEQVDSLELERRFVK